MDMTQTAETATCRLCGSAIENELRIGWIDARSGDKGGTYTYCPAADDNRGHAPA